MADGGMGKEVSIYDVQTAVAANRYAYAPNGILSGPFLGNVNVASKADKFALVPARVARFGFTATRTTDGGVNFLTVTQGGINLWNIGAGGAGSATNGGMTGNLTDAESMAGPTGGIVRTGATFVATGMEIRRESAWNTADASVTNVLGNRDWPDWISDNGPCGFSYPDELRKLIEPTASFRFILQPNRQIVEDRQGALADWMAESGRFSVPGNFIAFTNEYGSGGEGTSSKIQAIIDMGATGGTGEARVLRVQERAGLAIPAAAHVTIEYSMVLWGYVVCGNPVNDDPCAIPGLSSQSLGAPMQMLQNLFALQAAGQLTMDQFNMGMQTIKALMPGGGK